MQLHKNAALHPDKCAFGGKILQLALDRDLRTDANLDRPTCGNAVIFSSVV